MPRFVTPSPSQVRVVLRESHALWGAGLSVTDYVEMWEEMAESRWGRAWYSWRALVDDDERILSTLKLYRPQVRLGEAIGRAAAIGAVYTPRIWRGQGHAAALIRATCEEARARGDRPALLFTDIGTDYYRALGFTPLPCEDAVGTLAGAGPPANPGVRLRPMTFDDLDAVASAHDGVLSSRSLAVMRDRDHWEFLLLRAASFFRRLDRSGLERRFMIAMDGAHPIGYLIAVVGPGEWNLREAGAFDGDPETLTCILTAGAADALAVSAGTVWGWIPREIWPRVPGWKLRSQSRARAIPMIRMLEDEPLPRGLDTVEGAFIPYLDQF